MTVTDEQTGIEVDDTSSETPTDETPTEGKKRGRKKRPHDFTKFRDFHQEVADYVNAHSGLDPVTPNQIKAVLLLRTDFANTPEQVAIREENKKALEDQKKKYEGLNEEQIKRVKAAEKATEQAARFAAKAAEAEKRAKELSTAAEGSGADLAAQVEAQQNGAAVETTAGTAEPEAEPEKRRSLGRRNR